MTRKNLFLIGLFFLTFNMFSQDSNFHIYLCFGQSNMEGSATIEEQDKIGNDRFKVLAPMNCIDSERKKGEWTIAIPPLSQCWGGLSPADYFGRTMVENLPKEVTVGVVNVAIGGCDIRLFDKNKWQNFTDTYPEEWFQDKIKAYGGNPYKRFIELAKQAKKDGVIKGILLHQGETNQDDANWPLYVKTIYNNILSDLSLTAEEVPLIAGEVANEAQKGVCASMNKIIDKLPETIPTAYVISSKGCTLREDNVHFNSAGVRKLGRRYAFKVLSLE
ncbi:sialate O-acetylesterase [Polaribacter staleyi]|uniref:sialate O-acetylesterase n=1 Tax=Polaribacter staleyi TaxID=2022337 RepID=UPI0031BACD55